jgi:hypothetical protein
MADQARSKIIEDNPIGNGLDAFCASFKSIGEGAYLRCTPEVLKQLGEEGEKDNGGLLQRSPLTIT